jgi:hypothetical protein
MPAKKGSKKSSKKSRPRKTGAETSLPMARLASLAIRKPSALTTKQIRQLGGAALRQFEGPTVPVRKQRPKK